MLKIRFYLLFSVFSFHTAHAQLADHAPAVDSAVGVQQGINKEDFKPSLITSSVLVGTGLIALTNNQFFSDGVFFDQRNEHIPDFATKADDYLSLAPAAVVYGLDWSGVEARTPFWNRSLILAKAEIITMAIVYPLKYGIGRLRPDESEFNSFPSGHTAHAFMTATFMHREYADRSIWFSIGAYTTATSVGVLRVMNNRHYISDVLVGAGVGIFATNLAYLTHRYRFFRDWDQNFTLVPSHSNGATGVYLCLRF